MIFYIAAGVYLFGSYVYWNFASGELQSWANGKKGSSVEANQD